MPAAAAPTSTIRFAGVRFDAASGELWPEKAGGGAVQRLPPQPAKLLAHLIEQRPRIVDPEEIRQLLWPEVQVEFEQSLHTCVRQIRSALGDSATEPRFVETIPRRGYRFVAEIEEPRAATASPARGRRALLGVAGAVGVVLVLAAASVRFGFSPPAAPLRIAVMPFEPLETPSALAPDNGLAEGVVAALVRELAAGAEIVGPTTTAAYDGRPVRVRDLATELEIDLLIHARPVRGETGPRALVEVIRVADGAHLWARYLDEMPASAPAAETIAAAAAEAAAAEATRRAARVDE